MKVLLASLDSKYAHTNLALKYLYAAASGPHISIEIKEFTINQNADYVFVEILSGGYNVICFSCYIWNLEETVSLSEDIKKAQPDSIIVFGGPEAGYETADFMLAHEAVDFVVMGEGEHTFSRLVHAISSGETSYGEIGGLAYRRGGEIFINSAAEPLVLETIPFPYHKLPCEKDKVAYYESSRGCPFNCSYCISSLEKKVRELPLERVFRDLAYFIEKEVKQVKLVDRTFNWDPQRCKQILRHIIKADRGITNFHFEICGELIDDEFADIAGTARKGLFQFEVGIQSTNKETLKAVERSTKVSELLENTRKITILENVETHVDLIAGLPYESYPVFEKSFNDAYGLGADEFHLGFLKLLKGTRLREKAASYCYEFRSKPPYEVISNMFLSAKDVCILKQVAEVLKLYRNRGGFEKTLEYVISTFAKTPFAFFEEFAMFYYLKGFQHRAHKKEDLYRIFFAYAGWKCKKLDIKADEAERILKEDMKNTLNQDAVRKFERKGWSLQAAERM